MFLTFSTRVPKIKYAYTLKAPPQTEFRKNFNFEPFKNVFLPSFFQFCTQLSVVLFRIMPDAGFIKQKQENNGLKAIRSTEAAVRLILKCDNTILGGISTLPHFWHASAARQAGCVEAHCDWGGNTRNLSLEQWRISWAGALPRLLLWTWPPFYLNASGSCWHLTKFKE